MESTRILFISLSLILIISGCTNTQYQKTSIDWYNPIETINRTTVERDDFKKMVRYKAPNLSNNSEALFLRAWESDNSNQTLFQVYIRDAFYGQWRFYDSAYDSDGNELKLTSISKVVGSCVYGCILSESVGININEYSISNYLKSGLTLKLYGSGGSEIFTIPAAYIQGFLTAISTSKESHRAVENDINIINEKVKSLKQSLTAIEEYKGRNSEAYRVLYPLYESALKAQEDHVSAPLDN